MLNMNHLEIKLGYRFKDKTLLERALTHKSFVYESKDMSRGYYEVLEYLGDAVLDLMISELLIQSFPEDNEGLLTKKRAGLVNEKSLAKVAAKISLHDLLHLGKGEAKTGGSMKPRLLASCFEAVVGALFQDSSYEEVKKVILPLFEELINESSVFEDLVCDYKTQLQEIVQSLYKELPSYEILSEEGPSHEKIFTVQLKIADQVVSEGKGKSKKYAEQEAAKMAFLKLKNNIESL